MKAPDHSNLGYEQHNSSKKIATLDRSCTGLEIRSIMDLLSDSKSVGTTPHSIAHLSPKRTARASPTSIFKHPFKCF
ncbi:hypothetical protein LguiB_006350 [Lonicera macranthoides]